MRLIIISICIFILSSTCGKSQEDSSSKAGNFSLGVRNSIGFVYENDWNRLAFGSGGHFRLRFSEKVNSQWFIDYLQGDLFDFGKRTDVHIGWSVMYYPFRNQRTVQPYVLAGHCFELLRMEENANFKNNAIRRSASVQAGTGIHFHIAPNADISIETQYMMHFGTNIDIITQPNILFHKPGGLSLQDHFLVSVSLNFYLFDLW